MRKTLGLLGMAFLAAIVVYIFVSGGRSVTSEALAVPPTVLSLGVEKDIVAGNISSGILDQYIKNTSEVTVIGTTVSFRDKKGKQVVYINAPVRISER